MRIPVYWHTIKGIWWWQWWWYYENMPLCYMTVNCFFLITCNEANCQTDDGLLPFSIWGSCSHSKSYLFMWIGLCNNLLRTMGHGWTGHYGEVYCFSYQGGDQLDWPKCCFTCKARMLDGRLVVCLCSQYAKCDVWPVRFLCSSTL